jgi:endogenous inhibitor of DNA gyrase (YacG/DUF329 family)
MPREVKCPRCGKPALFAPENKYRPFCSERCKTIDFGDWADGKYSIPLGEDKPSSSETKEKGTHEDDID